MVREDAEALRRRLYAPGAAGDDVERYRAAGGGAEAAPPEVEPEPVRRAHPIRVALIGAAVVVALVLAGIGVARVTAPARPTAPAPTPLVVSASERRGFQDELAAGNGAGIAAYLLTSTPLPRFRAVDRAETLEGKGVGPGTVTLSPVSAAAARGRATVILVLAVPAQAEWSTFRRRVDPSGEQEYVEQVRRAGTQQSGEPTIDTYRYASGDRPVELRVDVPDDVRWGAAVVFTD